MTKYNVNPWLEIQGMKEKMDSLMDEVLDRFEVREKKSERLATWCPVADSYETQDSYVIQVELAGLDKDQVSIELKGNELWVYGERRMVKEVSSSRYQFLERSYGPFARKFTLGHRADESGIRARFREGLLTIVVRKGREAAGPQKIEVSEDHG
ncbi:MAG: Hsp20/alpha crystallin family protein [Thermodesulfobacteriota bacterium]